MSADHKSLDGFVGALIAFEGVRDSITILNGPTGCKYYPASLSESMFERGVSFNPLVNTMEFYFGQSRIPCTYLDSQDYIMGTESKMLRIDAHTRARNPSFIGMINSPGASLIGDCLRVGDDSIPTARLESPGYSERMGEGFQKGVLCTLKSLQLRSQSKRPGAVNLLGLSIWHLGWKDSLEDLTHLLHLCGIEVICTLGVDCSVEEMQQSTQASLNIVVDEDFSLSVCEWYEQEWDIPYVLSPHGCPIGFDYLEEWIVSICAEMKADPTPAQDEIKEIRKRVYREISRLHSATGLPKGRTFSIVAHASLATPIVKFLHSYLGMVPVSVCINEGSRKELDRYLEGFDMDGIPNDIHLYPVDVMIGDANSIVAMMAKGLTDNGVDIVNPPLKHVKLCPEPVLGLQGTCRLLDLVLNALDR